MSAIQIIPMPSGGAAVKFPYQLKDQFRKDFPSAKWNAAEKQWEVSARSIERLQQFAETLEALAQTVLDVDAYKYDEKKLAEMAAKAARAEQHLKDELAKKASAEQRVERLRAARVHIEALQEKIDEAAAARADATAAADAELKRMHDAVSGIVDIEEVEKLRCEMRAGMKSRTAAGGRQFDEAEERLREILSNIRMAGIECEQIRQAVCANKNRPDRDIKMLSGELVFEEYDASKT